MARVSAAYEDPPCSYVTVACLHALVYEMPSIPTSFVNMVYSA